MTEPMHRPERQHFIVHVGTLEEQAVLPEWWGAVDSDTESRALRFSGEDGNWVAEDELPEALTNAGCRRADIVSTELGQGLAHPDLEVGNLVLLQPVPATEEHQDAIAVWTRDSQFIGYVAPEVAMEAMAEARRLGTGYGAFVASEQRDKASHERRSLSVLLGPGRIWANQTE